VFPTNSWAQSVAAALFIAAPAVTTPAESNSSLERSSPPPSRVTLRKSGEAAWSLVSPSGQPFFSLGVGVVTQGADRQSFDPENPGYAAWQHYEDPISWSDATLRRLKAWRFTTIGAWSDHRLLRQSREMSLWHTPVLHVGSTAGAPWWDMWDSKVIRRMDAVAREQILAVRDDPRLIGYYSDNEMGWWNATLWKMTLEQPASSGQRKRLVQLLRETYDDDWQQLRRDFEPEKAESWRELRRGGMLWLKPGGGGIKVMRRFLEMLAERYYQLVHDIIRKHDSRALILGDRYQSFYYPEVARAAARWVDAISSNLNPSWNDGTYLRCHLDTLHALTGRPVFVSEVYMSAKENRSGNRNDQGIFPVVATQSERAHAASNTLVALAQTPCVVGVDWFQYYDEPRHGRHDGENFNFGLVDIYDRPYAELTSLFAAFDPQSLRTRPASPRPDASMGVPPAPANPFADFNATHALKSWDRERGFVKPSTPFPVGDLYLCWNPRAIYLGLYALDMVEDAYYRDNSIPKSDRALWVVDAGGGQTIRVRLGAGREAIPSDSGVRVEHLPALNHKVRNVAAMELTAEQLRRQPFKAGDAVALHSVLWTHGKAYEIEWKGTFRLVD
jgi:hypothetical protein